MTNELFVAVTAGDVATVRTLLSEDPSLAFLLSRMGPPEFPTPVGVFRQLEKPTYADLMIGQEEQAIHRRGEGDLAALYRQADTWTVTANGK